MGKILCAIVGCSPGIIPALKELKGVFNSVFGGMLGVISTIASYLRNGVGGAINFVTWMWNALKGAVSAGVQGVVSIASGAISTAHWLWNALWGAVSGGVHGAVNVAFSTIKAAQDAWNNLVNTVKDIYVKVVAAVTGPGGPPKYGSSSSMINGAAGPIDVLKGAMSGIGYEHYYGHQKSPMQVIADGAGNCVDTTLLAMGLAGSLGMSSRMESGTWGGGGHVWGNYGGSRLDFARKSLNGTYIPPSAGPGRNGNTYIFNAPVYDWDKFKKDVEKANDQTVRRY
jgi:hypothetical protein